MNTALSERTALVISLLTVTIGLNCFCLLCQVHLCVQSRVDLPCNLVLNTTKMLNILIIYFFYFRGQLEVQEILVHQDHSESGVTFYCSVMFFSLFV